MIVAASNIPPRAARYPSLHDGAVAGGTWCARGVRGAGSLLWERLNCRRSRRLAVHAAVLSPHGRAVTRARRLCRLCRLCRRRLPVTHHVVAPGRLTQKLGHLPRLDPPVLSESTDTSCPATEPSLENHHTRRLLREPLGSAGAQAPCWVWPGSAWVLPAPAAALRWATETKARRREGPRTGLSHRCIGWAS
jgi:hypothetical protein